MIRNSERNVFLSVPKKKNSPRIPQKRATNLNAKKLTPNILNDI